MKKYPFLFLTPFQVQEEGPIERNTPKQDVKQEPYKLPTGFCWSVIDLNQEAEMDAVYGLLMANYVEDDDASFRFNYKKEFLRWGLQPPGYQQEWHIGVRVEATGKLMGFISGIPAQMRVRKQ
jgi:glycylpeptide N-tetradecanoyltransferase